MADKELSGITAAGTLDGTETVHVVQSGNSRRATVADIAGAGMVQIGVYDLTATSQTLDSGNEIDVDVSGYKSVLIIIYNLNFGTADDVEFRLSDDGGTSFYSGASDYLEMTHSSSGTTKNTKSGMAITAGGSPSEKFGRMTIDNLNDSSVLPVFQGDAQEFQGGQSYGGWFYGTASNGGAFDAIRFFSGGGNDATAGTLVIYGIR